MPVLYEKEEVFVVKDKNPKPISVSASLRILWASVPWWNYVFIPNNQNIWWHPETFWLNCLKSKKMSGRFVYFDSGSLSSTLFRNCDGNSVKSLWCQRWNHKKGLNWIAPLWLNSGERRLHLFRVGSLFSPEYIEHQTGNNGAVDTR